MWQSSQNLKLHKYKKCAASVYPVLLLIWEDILAHISIEMRLILLNKSGLPCQYNDKGVHISDLLKWFCYFTICYYPFRGRQGLGSQWMCRWKIVKLCVFLDLWFFQTYYVWHILVLLANMQLKAATVGCFLLKPFYKMIIQTSLGKSRFQNYHEQNFL